MAEAQTDSSTPLEFAWQAMVPHGIARPPLVMSQTVIVIDRAVDYPAWDTLLLHPEVAYHDSVYAFEQISGTLRWAHLADPNDAFIIRQLAISDKYVAFSTHRPNGEGTVQVLELQSGREVFAANMWALELAVNDELLFVRDIFRHLYAIDVLTGQPAWDKRAPAARGNRGLFVADDKFYQVYTPTISEFQATDGQLLREINIGWPGRAWVDGTQALVENATGVYYIDLHTGQPKWVAQGNNTTDYNFLDQIWPPAIADNSVVALNQSSALTRFALEDGRMLWQSAPPEGLVAVGPPVVWQSKIYTIWSDASLRTYDLQTGQALATPFVAPAILYWDNNPTRAVYDFLPGIAATDTHLVVSFGCRAVYGLTPP